MVKRCVEECVGGVGAAGGTCQGPDARSGKDSGGGGRHDAWGAGAVLRGVVQVGWNMQRSATGVRKRVMGYDCMQDSIVVIERYGRRKKKNCKAKIFNQEK